MVGLWINNLPGRDAQAMNVRSLSFSITALTSAYCLDPAIAIAASRAGHSGVLNLEFADPDHPGTWAALERLAGFTPGPIGIKVAGDQERIFTRMPEALRGRLGQVILTMADDDRLRGLIQMVRAGSDSGLRIFLEVTCGGEAALGAAVGVDGLIAKGNEAGGRVGSETAFILLQRLAAASPLPVHIQGGIGLHTVGAAYAAGAAGVVLDHELALVRESVLPEQARQMLQRMDGSETVCVNVGGEGFRFVQRRGHEETQRLIATATELSVAEDPAVARRAWRAAQRAAVDPYAPTRSVWPIGQDACFAARLATKYRTVYGVTEALIQALVHHVAAAVRLRPLAAGSPLAQSHRTRYPIVQGPMTRVSDRSDFAARVAEGGGLPFLALALMRAAEAEPLLNATRAAVAGRPWGVGILGFVQQDLREEQVALIRRARPDFALIAGGRPEQAMALEAEGIPTYLHVPSPGLLRLFLDGGARRFIFEGRECGGHVGPRSSFVLWEEMIAVLLDALPPSEADRCHVLFAGGIHDARSAAMVSVLAAGLAERGCRIGVLIGSAYIFTREAVETGAVVPDFQSVIRECHSTIELESGPGHVTRCADTLFASAFRQEKERLAAAGAAPEEVRDRFEVFNVGRLRIASKGVVRNPDYGKVAGAARLSPVDTDYQRAEGLYMIGQIAGIRDRVTTITELHEDLCEGGTRYLEALGALPDGLPQVVPSPARIAIVGMGCILPKAPDLGSYWENILDGVDAIQEVPEDRWDWQRYYDPDPGARDKVYSKWGGFIEDYPFDPLRYGIPPNSLRSIEPLHLLVLETVRAALEDAGYPNGVIADAQLRRRTSVIIGVGGGTGALGQRYAVRSSLPSLIGEVPDWILEQLPEWTEDSFPGVLLNITAGRVANRFDLGGVNFTVDAACGSSLAAVTLAVRELETGSSDMVIVGGADSFQNPFDFLAFSKTRALSPRGRCRTFDADADGIAISEGVSVVVLRRLADAEREGARIHALIQGTAGSSDGRDKSLTAPRPLGQALALRRAYGRSGIDPASVGLIEAHGTGTSAGDQAEVETLSEVFSRARATAKSCGLGSVKSMIGHTKAAAGTAGLIKMALALRHQVLPSTLNVERPNPVLAAADSPFYVLGESRPWIARPDGQPRRAGVSAFGFGGTNFHAVLEEYRGAFAAADIESLRAHWPAELLVLSADSRPELARTVAVIVAQLPEAAGLSLADLGLSLVERFDPRAPARLAIVAGGGIELRERLTTAASWLGSDQGASAGAAVQMIDPRGVFFGAGESFGDAPIAFLFPGQGSQYPSMLRDLALYFAQVRDTFGEADAVLADVLDGRLTDRVFPPHAFTDADAEAQRTELTRTEIAQPAIGAASLAMLGLLESFGLAPAMVAGHSYGEYVALHRAGVIDRPTLLRLSELRGRCIVEAAGEDLGTMASVSADADKVAALLEGNSEVRVANRNAPDLTVIAGTSAGVTAAIDVLERADLSVRRIPVACGFHSPCVAPASDRLSAELARVQMQPPALSVYSNVTAARYPQQPGEVLALLSRHLVSPVNFVDQIGAMYEDGARLFVEVGPHSVLTKLVGRILGDRPHIALASDSPQRSGLVQLMHLLGQLAAAGVDLSLARLFANRNAKSIDINRLAEAAQGPAPSPSTWLVNGGYVRPQGEPRVSKRQPPPGTLAAPVAATSAPAQPVVPPPAAPASAAPALAAPAPVAAPGLPASSDQVMAQYLRLSNQFLETQTRVMLTYLQGRGHPAAAAPGATLPLERPGVLVPAAEATPAPQTPAVFADQAPGGQAPASTVASASPPAPEPPQPSSGLDEGALRTVLLELVGERTGYPPEMLDLDLNIEADLGIDSIKRTEILGAFRKRLFPDGGDATVRAVVEQAAQQRTLRGIIDRFATLAVAVTAPPAPPVQPAEPPGALDADALRTALLNLVGERTGYPPEMLDLDLNVEADLGIDSIKRTEILGAFRKRLFPDGGDATVRAVVEQAVRERTLRGIIDRFATLGGAVPAPAAPSSAAPVLLGGTEAVPTQARPRTAPPELPRFLIEPAPLPHGSVPFVCDRGATYLVTDDEEGVAQCLVERLREHGAEPILLRHGPAGAAGDGVLCLDLTDSHAVQGLRESLPPAASLAGIFHCLPLRPAPAFDELTLAQWLQTVRIGTKSLFNLAMVFDPELGGDRGCVLVAAVRLGGDLGIGNPGAGLRVDHAGPGGLLKTLVKEWPSAHCRCVDFGETATPVEIAERLLVEAVPDGGPVEIGYQAGQRLCFPARYAPLGGGTPQISLGAESVILITGGARGITAEIAQELARLYRPKLILCGSSPLPDSEADDIRGITDARVLKASLAERLRRSGAAVQLARIESEFRRIQKAREIRASLDVCRAAGAEVEYRSVDVRDEAAFGGLIDALYERFGRIDGVVHGAGIVEDKLIGDKTGESFDRVVDTKVASSFVLSRSLRPETLGFLAFFTSVAGRFGNRGQSDYGAANEILSKLALELDRRWPSRVVAFSWGPWDKTGMVSPEIKQQFARLGVVAVPPQLGREGFDWELRFGSKGDAEVVWGDGPWRDEAAVHTAACDPTPSETAAH